MGEIFLLTTATILSGPLCLCLEYKIEKIISLFDFGMFWVGMEEEAAVRESICHSTGWSRQRAGLGWSRAQVGQGGLEIWNLYPDYLSFCRAQSVPV